MLGGTLPVGGFGAWVTYFLAGTELAFPIVCAMIVGGVGMLGFQERDRGVDCEPRL
jgi:hypothetical protein